MVDVGDRVRLVSAKGPPREGVVTAVTGALVHVRWPSGAETMVVPAPGTLTVLDDREDAPKKRKKKHDARKDGKSKKRGKQKKSDDR